MRGHPKWVRSMNRIRPRLVGLLLGIKVFHANWLSYLGVEAVVNRVARHHNANYGNFKTELYVQIRQEAFGEETGLNSATNWRRMALIATRIIISALRSLRRS